MKIIKIPFTKDRENEEIERTLSQKVLDQLKKDYENFDSLNLEEIHVDNSNGEEAEKLILENSQEELSKEDCVVFLCSEFKVKKILSKAFYEVCDNGFLIFLGNRVDFTLFEGINLSSVVVIGKQSKNDKLLLDKLGVKYFSEICDLEACADYVTEKAKGKEVYISLDLSVVDSAFAPGAFESDVLGLSSKELLYLLRRFFHSNVKAVDITGVSVTKDERYEFRTVKLTSKIIEEFLEIYFSKRKINI